MATSRWSYPKRILFAAAVGVCLLLLWQLSDVLVLTFGAIVIAAIVRGLARRIEGRFGLSTHTSGILSTLSIVALLGVAFWLVGGALTDQIGQLREGIPQAWAAASNWLDDHALGRQVLQLVEEARESGLSGSGVAGAASTALGALGSAVLMIIVGIYFALDPDLYRKGLLELTPPEFRPRTGDALTASGQALSRWLLGQSASMAFLGSTTALGLWLLDIPLALTLGFITALLAFVPFFGAIAGGLLSVLMAFTVGPDKALYVAFLFFGLQQVEEYLLQPFVQRWAVAMPPVLTMLSAVIFGILFGTVGVVFATPMMVIVMVLVRKLYIQGALESPPSSS
jgi:predicted PurR-regulated permease PerM